MINLDYINILFDLDGTLTDPKEGITNSVAHALEHFGIQVLDRDKLCRFIGPPLTDSFAEYYGFDAKKSLEAVRVYREYFSVRGIFENRIYDGVITMLEKLSGMDRQLFIATSKPEKFAVQIAKHFDFYRFFKAVRGIPLDGEGMTKGQVIASVIKEFSLDRTRTVMVGDRSYDVTGAAENGIDSIGVLYGYGGRDELEGAGAGYIADSISQLTNYLEVK